MIRLALDADERKVGIPSKLGSELVGRYQGRDPWEMAIKERQNTPAGGVGLEQVVERCWGEERTRECTILPTVLAT